MIRSVALLALLGLAACDDMGEEPKQKAYAPLPGPAPEPAGVVEYGTKPVAPPTVTLALLERGQERYRIYCTPCHGELGDGDGMVVQRGFPRPESFHTERLRQAPARHTYDAITNGYGVMYGFANRVRPADRWAITAYIRALQRGQDASADDLAEAREAAR